MSGDKKEEMGEGREREVVSILSSSRGPALLWKTTGKEGEDTDDGSYASLSLKSVRLPWYRVIYIYIYIFGWGEDRTRLILESTQRRTSLCFDTHF